MDISSLENQGTVPYMLYILKLNPKSKEDIVFGFPTKQYHGCIIDYSRSIIRPSMVNNFKDYNIIEAEHMKLVKNGPIRLLEEGDKNLFYKEQVNRILLLIENSFPSVYDQNKDQLDLLITKLFRRIIPNINCFGYL